MIQGYSDIRRLASALATMTAATVLVVGPASAQEPGVFIDPDSPAGKEYAIPSEEARRTGTDGPRKGADRPAPLFGTGVTPASGDGSGGGGDAAPGGSESAAGGDPSRAGAGGAGDGPDGSALRRAPGRVPVEAVASQAGWKYSAVAAVLVLLLGGLMATVALRLRNRRG